MEDIPILQEEIDKLPTFITKQFGFKNVQNVAKAVAFTYPSTDTGKLILVISNGKTHTEYNPAIISEKDMETLRIARTKEKFRRQLEEAERARIARNTPSVNSLCPCNSGKKYKFCCRK